MKVLKWIIILIVVALVAGLIVGLTLYLTSSKDEGPKTYAFPKDFKIGAASASYQIEGGWDLDGKSENIWDTAVHENPDLIADRLNGDVGADSYHLYKDDVKALKDAGVRNFYFLECSSSVSPFLSCKFIAFLSPGLAYFPIMEQSIEQALIIITG